MTIETIRAAMVRRERRAAIAKAITQIALATGETDRQAICKYIDQVLQTWDDRLGEALRQFTQERERIERYGYHSTLGTAQQKMER